MVQSDSIWRPTAAAPIFHNSSIHIAPREAPCARARHSLDASIVARVRDYAEKYLAESSRRSAEQAIAAIEFRIRIREQRLPQIEAWLARLAGP